MLFYRSGGLSEPLSLPIQLFGLSFGSVSNCLCLLFQLVSLRICLRFDGPPLILQRIRLGITRIGGSAIYAVCGATSALSRPIPLITNTRCVGCGLVLCGTCPLLRAITGGNRTG